MKNWINRPLSYRARTVYPQSTHITFLVTHLKLKLIWYFLKSVSWKNNFWAIFIQNTKFWVQTLIAIQLFDQFLLQRLQKNRFVVSNKVIWVNFALLHIKYFLDNALRWSKIVPKLEVDVSKLTPKLLYIHHLKVQAISCYVGWSNFI